jgi:hypothetical protein
MTPDIENGVGCNGWLHFLHEMPDFSRSVRGGSIKASLPGMLAETTLRLLSDI